MIERASDDEHSLMLTMVRSRVLLERLKSLSVLTVLALITGSVSDSLGVDTKKIYAHFIQSLVQFLSLHRQ